MMDVTLLCSAIEAPSAEDALPKRFSGIAYSGGVVPDYGPFGDVAIDLGTLKLPSKRLFALINHDPNQRAGTLELSTDGNIIRVDGEFMDTTDGFKVASEFKQGAPWEFSVRAQGKKRLVDRKTPIMMNGREMAVDLILSDASIREVSFVPAGADPNTTAIAFSMEDSMSEPTEATPEVEVKPEAATPESEVVTEPEPNAEATLSFQVTKLTTELELAMSTANIFREERDAIQVQLSAVTAERDAFKAELDAIAKQKRHSQVRALFDVMHRDWDDAKAEVYMSLSDEHFSMLQNDIGELYQTLTKDHAPELDASLSAELAVEGVALPTNPLDRAVAELRLATPSLTQEQAMARALNANPALYVSAV